MMHNNIIKIETLIQPAIGEFRVNTKTSNNINLSIMNDSKSQIPEFLHQGLVLRSDKQNSAQGSVFYVKRVDDPENQEYVLKVVSSCCCQQFHPNFALVPREGSKVLPSRKEGAREDLTDARSHWYVLILHIDLGFPLLISVMESDKTNEMLIDALGPNLRSLQKQCPNRRFNRATIFKMII